MIFNNQKNTPLITPLDKPEIIHVAAHLPHTGRLAISNSKLVYLDIDDAYIHALFPLLRDQQIKKPDYFRPGAEGAHITVVYPEEATIINDGKVGREYGFQINKLVAAEIGNKIYYVLLVDSPSLLSLRREYALTDDLSFKSYSIGFHITIGVYLDESKRLSS